MTTLYPRITSSCRRRARRLRPGFTLVEALIAGVILTMAVLALLQAVTAGHGVVADGLLRQRAAELADAMLEEIAVLPYADPDGGGSIGPEAGETTRQLFDNRDDFHNYSESANALADALGTSLPSPYQRFTRAVTVASESVTLDTLDAQPAIRVTVTVTFPDGRSWVVDRVFAEPAS